MADNLWALREQKKLSVATLASRAGLPIGLIMEYEAGTRSIDARHLARIARALYVEESQIRLRSDPRPGAGPLERQSRREEGRPGPAAQEPFPVAPPPAPAAQAVAGSAGAAARPRERGQRPPRPSSPPRPPAPARPSQLAHLQDLLTRMGRTQADLEQELGKPLSELDRLAASKLLGTLQTQFREGRGAERRRAYLPEAVDEYEHRYLTEAQRSCAVLTFSLFDGRTLAGQITGFGPYNITIRDADSSETTLNKLAIVSYSRLPAGQLSDGKEPLA